MIKLTYCLHRVPSLTRAEFQDYWRSVLVSYRSAT